MDFQLSDEQKDVQRAAREFAQGEFDPDLALELDQSGKPPESLWKKAAQLGFIGIHYPEEFGGQGMGLFESVLTIEAFCSADSGIGSALSMVDIGAEVILKFGSKDQKERFVIPLAKGAKRMSIAFAESEDGQDLSSLSTVSERRGNEYFLCGEKRFVLNATLADWFVTLCKEPKEGWITLIVERDREGINIHPIEKMGLRMIPFGDLDFREVRVDIENRIGNGGEGMAHVHHCHQVMGLRSAAQALGTAQGAFDRAMGHAKQRIQFGKKLSQFQAIRHKLADMAVDIEVARWLTYKSATEYDQGKMDSKFLSITQLEAGRTLVRVVDEALQIFGGYGYIAEQAIEHYFRDAWAIRVELGTEEEEKDAIAKIMFGPDSIKK
ncbi:MAG: acyl-CoA dehydrogenase family protein [Thermodesulfobacteriota bacterium]|nr:acyl-CoA dehydrogenase family protein [Thermodesulfobacteriota bacterium]